LASRFQILPFALLLLFLVKSATPVLHGDLVEWSRYGWLVKVLARNNEGTVQACSGSLISSTLVLTSSECVLNRASGISLTEFAVITTTPDSQRRIFSASLLEIKREKSWALVKISPQNTTELCPANPAPKMITRLNIDPKLLGESRFNIDFEQSECFLIGFETTEKASEFVNQNKTFRIPLPRLMSPEMEGEFHRTMISTNYTACYDDAGAALVCTTKIRGEFHDIQVGIFQALSVEKNGDGDKYDGSTTEMCKKALEMEFSLLTTDDTVLAALQKHNFKEFVATYEFCGFSSK